jgi:hypothetical protein
VTPEFCPSILWRASQILFWADGTRIGYANSAAPASVNLTNVPERSSSSQSRSIASLSPALYSAGVALCSNSIGPLMSSMKIRPSCTASTALAISISLRAAASGLA